MTAVSELTAIPPGDAGSRATAFAAHPTPPVVAVCAVGAAEGALAAAAALACGAGEPDRAPLLVDLDGRPPRPTLLASAASRQLEDRVAGHLPGMAVAARGHVCHLACAADADGLAAAAAALTVARGSVGVIHVPPRSFQGLLAAPAPQLTGVLLRAAPAADRALLALLVGDLRDRGLAVAVLKRRLGWVEERRALFGVLGADGGVPARVRDRVLIDSDPGATGAAGGEARRGER